MKIVTNFIKLLTLLTLIIIFDKNKNDEQRYI